MEETNFDNQKIAELEALLFAYGEPLDIKKIAKVLNLESKDVVDLINKLQNKLAETNRGLDLISQNNQVQLVTKPAFSKTIESLIKEELNETLTPAALETLSLISYFEPISKSKLDYLRGVNTSFILRNLFIRGLVEKIDDPNKKNHYLLTSSFELKKYLGITKKEDLPNWTELDALLKRFESGENQEQLNPEVQQL